MATATLDQSPANCDLRWAHGDPVSLAAVIRPGLDWVGAYAIESSVPQIAALTAVVTAIDGDTTEGATLTITSTGRCMAPAGQYPWRLRQANGISRLVGTVWVTQ